VRLPYAEFEAILLRAAEVGTKCAFDDVRLDGKEAAIRKCSRRVTFFLIASHMPGKMGCFDVGAVHIPAGSLAAS
jgi:hypothetical protein